MPVNQDLKAEVARHLSEGDDGEDYGAAYAACHAGADKGLFDEYESQPHVNSDGIKALGKAVHNDKSLWQSGDGHDDKANAAPDNKSGATPDKPNVRK